MSRAKLHSWRCSPGVWLWSFAFVLPPALAAIAASQPPAASSGETAWASPAALGENTAAEGPVVREARRVLIDIPGQDPMATLVEDLLYFDSPSPVRPVPAELPPAVELTVKPSPARSPAASIAPAEVAQESSPVIIPGLGTPEPSEEPAARTAAASRAMQAPAPVNRALELPAATAEPAIAEPAIAETKRETAPAEVPAAEKPSEAPAPLTPEMAELRDKIRTALARNYPRHLSAATNSPWEVMHGIIAYGVDTLIFKDRPRGGETVNAIGWMCYNYPCDGQRMLFVNGGQVDASRGVGVQGHAGQFLAILAQSRVMSNYPMLVEGKQFTLEDLIEREKATCVSGEELTFKLIALSHYLDLDTTWKTRDGQEWSIPRLIREELQAPIRGAACGGTHRLMGYSYAVNKRIARGEPVEGEFRRAQIYLKDYHRYTFSLQNNDGSFSTAWFERRANDPSIDRRIKTSGHILEWITYSLSDDELRDPRMVKAVNYLATLLLANDGHTWEIGPLGHALHGLSLYDERVFKDSNPPRGAAPLAGQADAEAREARRGVEWTD